MLAIERRKLISDRLRDEGQVAVSALSREFGVSGETIRRDLERFEQEGLVTRSYGGAVLKEEGAPAGDNILGAILAQMVADGEHIFLAPGAAARAMVQELRRIGKKDLTVITNAVEVLNECADYKDWDVISLGGTLQPGKFALAGPQTIEWIESCYADKAVISCDGIDRKRGVTDGNVMSARVKRAMLDNAGERIVAVEGTKFDRAAFSGICGTEEIDTIVTDTVPPPEWLEYFAKKGITCLYG